MGYVFRAVRGLENDLPKSLDVRRNARRWFDMMGLRAEAMAKTNAPVLTGALRSSINWHMIGTDITHGGVLLGRLQVGVAYGRRQEWEHKSRSFYAYRAVLAVSQEIASTLQSEDGAASVWLGTGRGWKGTWSWNPFFSEGGPDGSPRRFSVVGSNPNSPHARAYSYYVNRYRRFTTVASTRIRRR